MTCDQTQPLLDAFVAHDLGWGMAWRVRRHLAACPACAAELAETRRLDSRVRAWRDMPAPAGLQSRMAAALPATPPVSAPRRPVTARRVAVGLAGMAAAFAAFFWLTPGQPGRPTIAFADVEQAMEQVQTASWDETMMFYSRPGHPVKSSTSYFTKWLRRSPPALASSGGFQDVRFQDLLDARGHLERIAPGRYVVSKLREYRGGSIATVVEANIREITQPQIPGGLLGAVGTNRVKFSPTRQKHTVLDGQDRILFTRDQEIIAVSRDMSERHYFFHIKAWADPVTHRVVRIETSDAISGSGPERMVTTRSNFRYNQTPPPGVFDWSPPLGAKIYGGIDGFSAMMHEITRATLSRRGHVAAPDTPAPSRP